jgi:hypothetical protein
VHSLVGFPDGTPWTAARHVQWQGIVALCAICSIGAFVLGTMAPVRMFGW